MRSARARQAFPVIAPRFRSDHCGWLQETGCVVLPSVIFVCGIATHPASVLARGEGTPHAKDGGLTGRPHEVPRTGLSLSRLRRAPRLWKPKRANPDSVLRADLRPSSPGPGLVAHRQRDCRPNPAHQHRRPPRRPVREPCPAKSDRPSIHQIWSLRMNNGHKNAEI